MNKIEILEGQVAMLEGVMVRAADEFVELLNRMGAKRGTADHIIGTMYEALRKSAELSALDHLEEN